MSDRILTMQEPQIGRYEGEQLGVEFKLAPEKVYLLANTQELHDAINGVGMPTVTISPTRGTVTTYGLVKLNEWNLLKSPDGHLYVFLEEGDQSLPCPIVQPKIDTARGHKVLTAMKIENTRSIDLHHADNIMALLNLLYDTQQHARAVNRFDKRAGIHGGQPTGLSQLIRLTVIAAVFAATATIASRCGSQIAEAQSVNMGSTEALQPDEEQTAPSTTPQSQP